MMRNTSDKQNNAPTRRDSGYKTAIPLEVLRQFAVAVPYGYVISDYGQKHNPIIFVNPAVEKITGYKVNEILGKSCSFLLGKDNNQKLFKQLQDAVKKGQQATVLVSNNKKDGTLYYTELSLIPINDQNEKVAYCVWSQKDITDQVKTEEKMARLITEKEKRFAALMEHANEAIWRIDFKPPISLDDPMAKQVKDIFSNGIFSEANDAGAKIYGLTEGREVVDRPLNEFFHDSVKENVKAATDMVRSKFKQKNLLSKEKASDGKYKTILNNLSPFIEDNKVFYIWGSGLDISDLFETQKQLSLSKKELENKNIALRELIVQIGHEKREVEERIKANIEQVILPSLEKIKLNCTEEIYVNQLSNDLKNLTSPFSQRVTNIRTKLSPREFEVCNLVKNGFSNKEIANFLNIAVHTVEKHRRMARKKLGLVNKGINLSSFLLSE
ncbi:MAG: PAS domain S-box protein [Desulfobulbaceae bacterium]|jgi:PAS domain S-box-containing protein